MLVEIHVYMYTSCLSDVERGLGLVFQMGVVTIGFFLFDGVQPLDFIGPWVCINNLRWQPAVINCFVKDVFDSWKQFSKSQVQLLTFGKTKVLKIYIYETYKHNKQLSSETQWQNCLFK